MSWKSEKQKWNELQEENTALKKKGKVLDKIIQLIEDRKVKATYNSNGIIWMLPYQNISISVSDLNKLIIE